MQQSLSLFGIGQLILEGSIQSSQIVILSIDITPALSTFRLGWFHTTNLRLWGMSRHLTRAISTLGCPTFGGCKTLPMTRGTRRRIMQLFKDLF